MEGGREIECAMEKPSTVPPPQPPNPFKLSSHFQLSALFSRIIDGACEVAYRGLGMKMSQSLPAKQELWQRVGQQEEQRMQYLWL